MALTPYDTDLDRKPANFQPLTPLTLARAGGRGLSLLTRRSSTGKLGAPIAPLCPRAPAGSALIKHGIPRETPSVMLGQHARDA